MTLVFTLVCSVIAVVLLIMAMQSFFHPGSNEKPTNANRKAASSTIDNMAQRADYGVWTITYHSLSSGQTNGRTIQILEVQPNNRRVLAWCESSQMEKTFLLDMMSDIRDAKTGSPIDLEEWLLAYRRSRRKTSV